MVDPESEARESPVQSVLGMMRGYWISQGIFVAARLGIADCLNAGPRPSFEIAERVGVPEQSLYRLMRALASVGIFKELPARTFELTELGNTLRADVHESLRSSAIFMGEVLYRSWDELLHSIANNAPSFRRAFADDFFPYLGAHPSLGKQFQEMMAGLNQKTNQSVPRVYDFTDVECLVDVGGGNGSLLASILQAYPAMRGVLLELPDVLDRARQNLSDEGVLNRVEIVPGDFLSSVPEGGDAYMLRWILHDFEDQQAARILRSCREAMGSTGRLLVIEQVIGSADDPGAWIGAFLDLQMLILLGGQERTEDEFRSLFDQSCFDLQRVIRTKSPLSILESTPI